MTLPTGIVYREPTRRLELVELSLLRGADDTEPLLQHFLDSATTAS